MPFTPPHTLKKYPFVRILLPLIAGIILQWYFQLSILFAEISAIVTIIFLLLFYFISTEKRYSLRWLQGCFIMLLFVILGAAITYTKDIKHQPGWFGNYYKPADSLLLTIEEPLVEKTNSYKALASVNALETNGVWKNTTGKMLVYFKKDSAKPLIKYGSTLLVHKPIQPITNSGNPGAFDYNRYCLFQDITGQVFLKQNEYVLLPGANTRWLQQTLFVVRDWTIKTLQQNIIAEKEQGVAEALLIGYRDDLDKDLVQAYSNTGVVHIIAISGLHLGMIYILMALIFSYFKKYRVTKILKPVVILFVLWAFTLVAGAVPSILRSAVMFSFIVIGEAMGRKTNMYNTLAASAFCMLVFNPFMLWDVGFLLSYAAVISIVTFQQPVYNWFNIKNKALDKMWKLTSVTLSAQVLTIPIVIFYFHQFPNMFLITNFLVVPWSCYILYGEILLLCISFISGLAGYIGTLLCYMVKWMNSFIEFINSLPHSVSNNLQINVVQTWLLYGCIIEACIWLMQKSAKACILSLTFLYCFIISVSLDFIKTNQQQKLIVYNVPKQSAVDIIQGNHYQFFGDDTLLHEGFLRNFHLKPARTLNHVTEFADSNFSQLANNIIKVGNSSVLLIDHAFQNHSVEHKIPVDIIILSQNPKVYISQLQQVFSFKQVVFDSSNPLWKTELWKKDCENLHLRFHNVAQQGAFVMDL